MNYTNSEATPFPNNNGIGPSASSLRAAPAQQTVIQLVVQGCAPDCDCTRPPTKQYAHFHVTTMMHIPSNGGMLSPPMPTRVCCTDPTCPTRPLYDVDAGTLMFGADRMLTQVSPAPLAERDTGSSRTIFRTSSEQTLRSDDVTPKKRDEDREVLEAAMTLWNMYRHELASLRCAQEEKYELILQQSIQEEKRLMRSDGRRLPRNEHKTDVVGESQSQHSRSAVRRSQRQLPPRRTQPVRAARRARNNAPVQSAKDEEASQTPAQRAWGTRGLNNFLNELPAPVQDMYRRA